MFTMPTPTATSIKRFMSLICGIVKRVVWIAWRSNALIPFSPKTHAILTFLKMRRWCSESRLGLSNARLFESEISIFMARECHNFDYFTIATGEGGCPCVGLFSIFTFIISAGSSLYFWRVTQGFLSPNGRNVAARLDAIALCIFGLRAAYERIRTNLGKKIPKRSRFLDNKRPLPLKRILRTKKP